MHQGTNQGVHERGPHHEEIHAPQRHQILWLVSHFAFVISKLKLFLPFSCPGVAVGDEPLMIVMELATEGALKDYLKEHNRSMRSKLYMVMGAASGMNHIHTKNVIHCDIAARNCLYSDHKVSSLFPSLFCMHISFISAISR
jgi:serine/threonine protein kinase